METAKQNPDTCDCAIVHGLMVDCKWKHKNMVDENNKSYSMLAV